MKPNDCVCLCRIIAGVIFVSISAGCLSVANSPTPRFYMLHAVEEGQGTRKFEITPEAIIGINHVKIPEYQDRPQIVTWNKEGMIAFAQFDRWGESLDAALTRVMMENLSVMLPKATITAFPGDSTAPVEYQVIIDVVRLESRLDSDLVFTAQWSLVDQVSNKTVLIKKSEFRQPINPRDYHGLAEALSTVCASLSTEIAGSLAALSEN